MPTNSLLISRRGLLVDAGASLLCAPAIVRAASLMPVRRVIGVVAVHEPIYMGFVDRLRLHWMDRALQRGWDVARDGRTFGGISEAAAKSAVATGRARGWLPRVALRQRLEKQSAARR